MAAFPNWEDYAVHQKRSETGCVPTGYEVILRAGKVSGIDYESFQDEFDLEWRIGAASNDFRSVASAIEAKYQFVKFGHESFGPGDGDKKLARIEQMVVAQKPVLVSLPVDINGATAFHVVLVVDATVRELTVFFSKDEQGRIEMEQVTKHYLVAAHDDYAKWGKGNDIAYLA